MRVSAGVLLLAAATSAVGIALLLIDTTPRVDPAESSPTVDPDRPVLVALGDSFMSGEGIGAYLAGTSSDVNVCHRSSAAYPYRIAERLDMRLAFAACSGATTDEILAVPQWERSPDGVLGAQRQFEALSSSPVHDDIADVELVIISIGGNDAQFGPIVRGCLASSCQDRWPEWIDQLNSIEAKLIELYDTVRAAVPSTTRVLVTTYPAPITTDACGALGEQLRPEEIEWVLSEFLARLNTLIRLNASVRGFEVVEMEALFTGLRLCEAPYAEAAVNAFALQRLDASAVAAARRAAATFQGSFHPNSLGHALMAEAVLGALGAGGLPSTPPPTPPGDGSESPAASSGPGAPSGLPPAPAPPPLPPPIGCPPDAPDCALPPTAPPYIPVLIGPPFGDPTPEGIPCRGVRDEPTTLVTIDPEQPMFRLRADPGTTVCFREQFGAWTSAQVATDGTVDIPTRAITAKGAVVEVFFEDGPDDIDKVVLLAPNGFEPPSQGVAIGPTFGLAATAARLAAGVLVVAVAHQIHCWRCRRAARAAARPVPHPR